MSRPTLSCWGCSEKSLQLRASPAKFARAALPLGHLSCPAAPGDRLPAPSPRLSGRSLQNPRSPSMDGKSGRCGPCAEGGAGRHGDLHLIELIQAAADTGRENPGDPRHAAPGFPRGNSTDGSPPDSTGTVQRHSPRVSAQAPRTCPGRRKGAARRPAPGKLRPARPCVGEKVPSRGGRAQLQPAPRPDLLPWPPGEPGRECRLSPPPRQRGNAGAEGDSQQEMGRMEEARTGPVHGRPSTPGRISAMNS